MPSAGRTVVFGAPFSVSHGFSFERKALSSCRMRILEKEHVPGKHAASNTQTPPRPLALIIAMSSKVTTHMSSCHVHSQRLPLGLKPTASIIALWPSNGNNLFLKLSLLPIRRHQHKKTERGVCVCVCVVIITSVSAVLSHEQQESRYGSRFPGIQQQTCSTTT